MKEFISLKGAATIIGVHPSTVRLWSGKGILPAHRTPGGHRRYKRADVELWAEHARRGRLEPEAIMQSACTPSRMKFSLLETYQSLEKGK